MKYLIAGIIGGVVSTIWSLIMIVCGMVIGYKLEKYANKERRTYVSYNKIGKETN